MKLRSLVVGFGAAWLVLGAIILGRFADEALPASYLVRPLVAATVLAFALGAVSVLAGRYSAAAAAGMALLIALPEPVLVLTMTAGLIGAVLLRRRGRMGGSGEGAVLAVAGVFFALGLIRAFSVMDIQAPSAAPVSSNGPPMYVVLLDGYPRLDTLATLGIDNRPFVEALEARGFDHYPDASSIHTRTNKTLLAMLTTEDVSNDPGSVAERRAIRERLVVPPGFVAIDPPVGYVTLGSGPHVDPGGMNDFEAQLLGQSVVGTVAPDWGWSVVLDGLRDRLDRSLDLLASRSESRVFAHMMAPHPPFLYGPGGSTDVPRWCWPACGAFTNSAEDLSVSTTVTTEMWAGGMEGQLEALNARLLTAVDRILADHPDAVVVLFSDHGARHSNANEDEKHRSFLVARTPGHPGLFADAPRPDTIIRALLSAYP